MIVCLCNCLNEASIVEVINAGCQTREDVHQRLGVTVQCGSCLDYVDTLIAERSAE